jgi:hypothetical protein
MNNLVTSLFKVINFIALIAALYYIFKTKMLARLLEQMKEKEIFWFNLDTNKNALMQQQEKLSLDIDQQTEYAQHVLGKVTQWHRQATARSEQEKQIAGNIRNSAILSQQDQQAWYSLQKNIAAIAPRVLSDLQDTLTTHYAKNDSQIYIDRILQEMKKSMQ